MLFDSYHFGNGNGMTPELSGGRCYLCKGVIHISLFHCTHLFLPHHKNYSCPSEASVTNSIIFEMILSRTDSQSISQLFKDATC